MNNYSEIPNNSSDCISRQAVIDLMMKKWGENFSGDDAMQESIDAIRVMPSVTPQEPKTGHWIPSHIPESILDECSECGFSCGAFTFNYCPNCGAKMFEPQESEDTETWNGIHAQITAPKGTFERIFNDADDDNDI